MVTNEIGQESRPISLAGVRGDKMNSIGSFIEGLSSLIDLFRMPCDLRSQGPLQHIDNYGARMRMWRRRFAGAVVHLNYVALRPVPSIFGKGLVKTVRTRGPEFAAVATSRAPTNIEITERIASE